MQVFKAVLNSVEPVALKLLGSRDQEPDPDSTARAIRELELLRDCRNPRIVQFLGASIFNRQVGIVTELMPLGDLHSALAGAVLKWGPKCVPPGLPADQASITVKSSWTDARALRLWIEAGLQLARGLLGGRVSEASLRP